MRCFAFLVAVVLVVACKGTSAEQLRADGWHCQTKGNVRSVSMKEKEHCFVCENDDQVVRCLKDPATSTCKETKQSDCQPNPK
jgi:hypothetical protein